MSAVRSLLRRTGIGAAVVALAGAGLVAAPSASAATTVTCTAAAAEPTTTIGVGESITFTVGTGCNRVAFSVSMAAVATLALNGSVQSVSGTINVVANDTVVLTGTSVSVGAVNLVFYDNAQPFSTTYPIVIAAGGNGGDSAQSAPASVPVAMTLSLGADAGGAVCKEGSAEQGMSGAWMRLPGQGDCSLPSKPDATLLGWSTSASFPVAIAQRQADNKWGTYELTDADGVVTAVFIPAGWSTFVTAANSLYPVWAA